MKVLLWKFWLVIPLCYCEVKCGVINSCSNLQSINCGDYVIAITKGLGSVVPKVLEQCNARHKCEVPIQNGQCVYIEYWCKSQTLPQLETKISSIMPMKINQTAVGLMSQDYLRGIYQSTENINCDIKFIKQANETLIEFNLFDFAAFANSTDFCLYVEDSTILPFCSGSHNNFAKYGPFNLANKKKFSFTLESTSTVILAPKVRFWFDISVSGGVLLDMVCQFKPVYTSVSSSGNRPADNKSLTNKDVHPSVSSNGNRPAENKGLTNKDVHPSVISNRNRPANNKGLTNKDALTIITSVSVVGGFLLVAIVAFILLAVLRYRWNKYLSSSKKSKDSGEYTNFDAMNDIPYMDIDSTDSSSSDEEITKKPQKAPRKSKLKRQASGTTNALDVGSYRPLPSAFAIPQEISPTPGFKAPGLSRQNCAKSLPVDDTKETGSQASSAFAGPQEISPTPGFKAPDMSRQSCANSLSVDDTKETGSQASSDLLPAPVNAGTAVKAEQDEKEGDETTSVNVTTITESDNSEVTQESDAKEDDVSQQNHDNCEPNNAEPGSPETTKADIHVHAEKDQLEEQTEPEEPKELQEPEKSEELKEPEEPKELEETENGSVKKDTDTGSTNEDTCMSLMTMQSNEENNETDDNNSPLGDTDTQEN